MEDIERFLLAQGELVKQGEASMFIRRYDRDADCMISYPEFEEFIMPLGSINLRQKNAEAQLRGNRNGHNNNDLNLLHTSNLRQIRPTPVKDNKVNRSPSPDLKVLLTAASVSVPPRATPSPY